MLNLDTLVQDSSPTVIDYAQLDPLVKDSSPIVIDNAQLDPFVKDSSPILIDHAQLHVDTLVQHTSPTVIDHAQAVLFDPILNMHVIRIVYSCSIHAYLIASVYKSMYNKGILILL